MTTTAKPPMPTSDSLRSGEPEYRSLLQLCLAFHANRVFPLWSLRSATSLRLQADLAGSKLPYRIALDFLRVLCHFSHRIPFDFSGGCRARSHDICLLSFLSSSAVSQCKSVKQFSRFISITQCTVSPLSLLWLPRTARQKKPRIMWTPVSSCPTTSL